MKIDRTIPLWGLVMVALSIVGQGVLLWAGQREQAIEQKHLTAQVAGLTAELKSLAAQISSKDGKDAARDSQLSDHERRLLRLENR